MSDKEHIIYLDDWLEKELVDELGIDLNQIKFNEENYYLFKKENLDFLILKLEHLNDNFELAMNDLFNEKIKMINTNLSEEKSYNEQYNRIKEKIKISNEIFEVTSNSRYFKLFYK